VGVDTNGDPSAADEPLNHEVRNSNKTSASKTVDITVATANRLLALRLTPTASSVEGGDTCDATDTCVDRDKAACTSSSLCDTDIADTFTTGVTLSENVLTEGNGL
jgi:hypothetical protein